MADSLESILKDLREQLLTNVNAQPIADDACDKEIIPEELKTSINQAKSVTEANKILYQHLLQQGTQSKLKELCTIMINAKGYSRMIEFGQVLLTKITAPVEQRIEVCQQNGSDGIEVVDSHMLWQINRIAKERTWDPVRKLYLWICTRVADLLQGRLPNIKVSIDNQYGLKCSPYDKLTQQDLENIRSCALVAQIMQIVGISKQWLDVSYLEHFIRDMADPPTVDITELWLNRYKQLLQYVCCKVLLRDAPGDHEVLQGLLKGVEAKIQSSRVLIVIYDIDYKCFSVAQLLEEKECLGKLLGIRPGCLNCLRVEPAHSVAIYWLIDKRHMLDGRRIFWPLLLRQVTSLELDGSPTLSLKGGHVPYLIRDALLTGQNLIQQTEVFSRQFLALVGPTDHPLENSNNAEVQHRRLLMRLLKAPPSHRCFLQESDDKDVPQTVKVEHESEGRELEDVLPKLIAGILAYWHGVLGAAAVTALTTVSPTPLSPAQCPPTGTAGSLSVCSPTTRVASFAPPPHTPGPAQTEATSQPQPSVSLWEGALLTPPPVNLAQSTHTGAAHTLSVCSPHSEASSSEFLDHFRQQFIAEVDASTIVLELEHRGIISDGDQKTIRQEVKATLQAQLLHACLKKTCDAKALTDVCDIIATVKGNPRMKSFGEHMKTEWEKVSQKPSRQDPPTGPQSGDS